MDTSIIREYPYHHTLISSVSDPSMRLPLGLFAGTLRLQMLMSAFAVSGG
jgi:hypothetical protein